jgi:hypothetical protein
MFEEKGEKLLRQVEPLIDQKHQHPVCQLVSEWGAAACASLSHGFGFHDDCFALLLLALEGL